MAIMREKYRERFPNLAGFLVEALPRAAADPARRAAFRTWSTLDDSAADRCLALGNTDPWLDIGDVGYASDGTAARGAFYPNLPNRVRIATDLACQFELDHSTPEARRLIEATVLHELVHWGYASRGGVEGPGEERGVSFEEAAYGGMQTRYGDLVDGRFPAQSPELASPPPEDLVERTVQAIVNVFETGAVLGDYSAVTLLEGDSGGLTYGRSQTTLNSGGLAVLLDAYCTMNGAQWAARVQPYLPAARNRDQTLESDTCFKNLLRAAADDPLMREAQDAFFAERYWSPARRAAGSMGIFTPLGVAVVYDSHVHGSWNLIRGRTTTGTGDVPAAGERAWIEAYIAERHRWLAGHSKPLLRRTTYRMEAFRSLIAHDAWQLPLPLVVRGQEISATSLAGSPDGCYDGPSLGARTIRLTSPLQRGADVRKVQVALSSVPYRREVVADGVFGNGSVRAVQAAQRTLGLPETGTVGPGMLESLELTRLAEPMSDLASRLLSQVQRGAIIFDAGKETLLEAQLLRRNAGQQIAERLQALILELSEIIDSPIRISSLFRSGPDSHHGSGRAVDIGNEEIADQLLPLVGTPERVDQLHIDEVIFDASIAGLPDRDAWNFDQGQPHSYNARTLDAHRDHIHFSVLVA